MSEKTKKIIKFVIIYLIISSMYIGVRISFQEPVFYENLLFEETNVIHNAIRIIMGIPPVSKGFGEYVSPKFLIEIVIKIIIAIILSIYLLIDKIKNNNEDIKKEVNIFKVISKVVIILLFSGIYLLYLYLTYIGVHCIR